MATLVKWEAGLIFAVGVLPSLFRSRPRRRAVFEIVHRRLARGYRPGLSASTHLESQAANSQSVLRLS